MARLWVGIDVGKDGAIVALTDDGLLHAKTKTPVVTGVKSRREYDEPGMVRVLQSFEREGMKPHVTIEKAQPLPPTMGGTQTNFARGLGFGLWKGILTALQIPHTVVASRTWQPAMFADQRVADTRQASIVAASRLWPHVDWRRSEKAQKQDDGLTDAALLAEYGRRLMTRGATLEIA